MKEEKSVRDDVAVAAARCEMDQAEERRTIRTILSYNCRAFFKAMFVDNKRVPPAS